MSERNVVPHGAVMVARELARKDVAPKAEVLAVAEVAPTVPLQVVWVVACAHGKETGYRKIASNNKNDSATWN